MKIVALGDVHGNFDFLNSFIEEQEADVILQCGDNAYYWNKDNTGIIKPKHTKVYFTPGNHENWDMFEEKIGRHGTVPIEVEKNIFMCPIGSTLTINGKVILFVGGADSIDKEYRLPKVSWWSQEILNYNDFDYISKNVRKTDIIISHTCPTSFQIGYQYYDKINDPSRAVLNLVLTQYQPKLWFFGHWHDSIKGRYEKTDYIGLNMIKENNFYTYLII
jgi:Icc-related predicted phosphoesterase